MILAGVAETDITPARPTRMAGFAARTGLSEGAHDRLKAYSLVATSDNGTSSVIICADLVSITLDEAEDLIGAIADRLRLPEESIAVHVTHNHGGPLIRDGEGGHGPTPYYQGLRTSFVEVADNAWKGRLPVRVKVGRTDLEGVAYNRRGYGLVDPAVVSIGIADYDGNPVATVFSYACHAVTLGADNLALTADWPGFARAKVERETGAPGIFIQGCAGQINTGHRADESFSVDAQQGRTFAEARRIGERVGAAAIAALQSAQMAGDPRVDDRIALATERVTLPLRARQTKGEIAALRAAWAGARTVAGVGESALLDGWIRWADRALDDQLSTTAPTARVAAHRWGEALLVFLPGEPFAEIGLRVREELGSRGVVVAGYTNGVPGYIAYPPEQFDAGGYEVTQWFRGSDLAAGFSPEAGIALCETGVRVGSRAMEAL